MFLILDNRPATNVFTFSIDAPGLRLGPDPFGTPGALAFTDRNGMVVGEIPRPFMQDSSYVEGRGGGLYSEAVSMSYTGGAGQWLLTLTIDPAFLDEAVYPVYVDPSVTSFPNQDATAQDTFASSKYPGSNFNTYQRPDGDQYHEMWLGNEPGTSYYNQVFMRFRDIDTVLGDVIVDSAYLEFYPYWQYYHSTPRQSWMKRITSDWQKNQLTWNNRPSVEGVAAPYNGAADYMSFYTTQGTFSHVDVTQYVQDVVDGDWVNNGFQISVDSQGQGGWKRIVSLDEDAPANLGLLPHLDVTWSEAEGTGIDAEDDPSLTYAELGYSQSVVDDREADLLAYSEQDPNGLAGFQQCEGGCGGAPPVSDGLSRTFTIYREQEGVWCVPAIVQSMLDNLRPASENWSGGGTIAGVKNKQLSLVGDILEVRNAKVNPDISEIPRKNGIGTQWGLAVLNSKLQGSYRYVEANASSLANMRQRIKYSINVNDVPVFLEINLRAKEWAYAINPNKNSILTHATAAIAYGTSGASFTVADTYLTQSAAAAKVNMGDYYAVPAWGKQPAGPEGTKWPIGDIALYAALAKLKKDGSPRNNMWY